MTKPVATLGASAPSVIENLTDEECYLFAILSDESGLDSAEFLWYDPSVEDHTECSECGAPVGTVHRYQHGDADQVPTPGKVPTGCFRAWAYQWVWWRCMDPYQVDQAGRSIGKSLSIKVRGCAFPFVKPGQEMLITAPELVHLEPITGLIETQIYSTRLYREMIMTGRSGVTHRPFQMNFVNGSRIIGRIPQRDGRGVKGCATAGTPVLTMAGLKMAEDVRPGDLVLTHQGRWRPVLYVERDVNDCYEVRGQGSFPLSVSCDHRFFGAENEATVKQKRRLLPLGFHDVEQLLDLQIYWATPTQIPELEVPDAPGEGKAFWWLVGRWLADGYLSMDRKRNKARRVHWVVHPKDQAEVIDRLDELGWHHGITKRSHSSADVIDVASARLREWLLEHFGELSDGKRLPAWALNMEHSQSLLDGYLSGDGHWNASRQRWELGTASQLLAVGLQFLAQGLGYYVNCTKIDVKPNAMCVNPKPSWRLQLSDKGVQVRKDGYLLGKVKSVEPIGKQPVFNIVVDEDHSYMTGSIMSHNMHPIWLEHDEGQDYPHDGWVELRETLKRGHEGARWRVHGVTRGVRDDFYEVTQDSPDNPFRVHRWTAMHRPTWTDREREEKIAQYGSREDPDYRRNVLGAHGDATNPIFVLAQLMKNVDDDPLSDYNTVEYYKLEAKVEQLELAQTDMIGMLDFPLRHLDYRGELAAGAANPKANYWVGMDVGYTIDPSEILVWVEYKDKPKDAINTVKLIARVSLIRMPIDEQLKAIISIIDFYHPKAFAMDKGGNGLPLFQQLQRYVEAVRTSQLDEVPPWVLQYRESLERALTVIKGYNFSSKLLVEIDESLNLTDVDDVTKAGLHRNCKDYSTDTLRAMVDRAQLILPWDDTFLTQFQGSTFQNAKGGMDQYGRRIYSKGNDHCLDAARFMALAHSLHSLEELMLKPKKQTPVLDAFVSF